MGSVSASHDYVLILTCIKLNLCSFISMRVHRWFTSMIGRKSNLKFLTSKLWEVGVTVVKTTEFVQGRTSRWGLAWSFLPIVQQKSSISLPNKNTMSFMLEV